METNNIFSAEPSRTEAGPGPRSTPGNDDYAAYISEDYFDLRTLACADFYPETLFVGRALVTDSESRPVPVLAIDTGDCYESNNVHRSGMDGIDRAGPW